MSDIDALTPLDMIDKYIAAMDLEGAMEYLSDLEKYGTDHPIYKEAKRMLKAAPWTGLVKEDANEPMLVFGR